MWINLDLFEIYRTFRAEEVVGLYRNLDHTWLTIYFRNSTLVITTAEVSSDDVAHNPEVFNVDSTKVLDAIYTSLWDVLNIECNKFDIKAY